MEFDAYSSQMTVPAHLAEWIQEVINQINLINESTK